MMVAAAPGSETAAFSAAAADRTRPEWPPAGGSPCAQPKPPPTGGPSSAKSPFALQKPAQKSTQFQQFGPGVAYYGYRWLDPATGRWPSRDPIGEVGSDAWRLRVNYLNRKGFEVYSQIIRKYGKFTRVATEYEEIKKIRIQVSLKSEELTLPNIYCFNYNNAIRNVDIIGLGNEPSTVPVIGQILPIITGAGNLIWYLGNQMGDDPVDDGYMHCVTQCRMKKSESGSGVSEMLGDLHEWIDESRDAEDDQRCNKAGRDCAEQGGMSCHECCVSKGHNP